ncbi:hypothetical protein GIB67_024447 [Kingdonia uniflora]|uniref:TOG domain-containing protein n=1 Tax=Kingdonia uniflora TaxID=39325 RepID=A0A7J7P4Q2_9MAGN|nr:hypothetical protein GIB67_024447 [Kingdonia uniflora]
MTASDIFIAFGDNLLESSTSDAFDQLLLQLLLKASQDKRFVCEEADKALHTLVRYTPPLPLLQKLRVYVSHANFRVRAKSAVFISDCISKMGLEGMKEFGLGSLVQIAADSLKDRLPEARKSARCMVTSIYEAFTGDEEQKNPELSDMEIWQKICSTNLPPIQVQALVKIISS